MTPSQRPHWKILLLVVWGRSSSLMNSVPQVLQRVRVCEASHLFVLKGKIQHELGWTFVMCYVHRKETRLDMQMSSGGRSIQILY